MLNQLCFPQIHHLDQYPDITNSVGTAHVVSFYALLLPWGFIFIFNKISKKVLRIFLAHTSRFVALLGISGAIIGLGSRHSSPNVWSKYLKNILRGYHVKGGVIFNPTQHRGGIWTDEKHIHIFSHFPIYSQNWALILLDFS